MRVIKLTFAPLALLSPASVLTAAHAASISTAGLNSIPANSDNNDWMTTLVQENEGIPNPSGVGRCALIGHPLADVHGQFIGYRTLNVCK